MPVESLKNDFKAITTKDNPKGDEYTINCEICGKSLGLTGDFWKKYKDKKMSHLECKAKLNDEKEVNQNDNTK